jgi:hypothetical protein
MCAERIWCVTEEKRLLQQRPRVCVYTKKKNGENARNCPHPLRLFEQTFLLFFYFFIVFAWGESGGDG